MHKLEDIMYEKILKLAKAYVVLASRKLQPYPISDEERSTIYRIAKEAVQIFLSIRPQDRKAGFEFYTSKINVGNVEIPIIFVLDNKFNAFYDSDELFIQINVDENNKDNLLFQTTLTLIHEYTHVFQDDISFNNFLYSMLKQFIEFASSEKDFDRVFAFNNLVEFVAEQYPNHLRQFAKYRRALIELPLTELENLKNRMYDTSPDEREALENELLERIRYNKLWDFADEYIRSGYQKQRIKQLVESYAISGQLDLTEEQISRIADEVFMDIDDHDIVKKVLEHYGKNRQQPANSSVAEFDETG